MDASRQDGGGSFPSGGREVTRAERFEEEKRRIVDSCFVKKDTDGSCKIPLIAFHLCAVAQAFRLKIGRFVAAIVG